MSYHDFRKNWSTVDPPTDFPVCLHDQDGTILYETDDAALRNQIIRLNDLEKLKQYIEKDPARALAPAVPFYHDPFFVAAESGSTEALRLLLDLYNSGTTKTKSLDERKISLFNIACQNAHIDMACFLLDSQPPLGDIRRRTKFGDTAVLSAASSLENFNFQDFKDKDYSLEWIKERFARSEELIHLLLDRGASARDSNTVGFFRDQYDEEKLQPRDTVLSLAITRASSGLVKRLIENGADKDRKDWYARMNNTSFGGSQISAQNVSVLHIGSLYWNVEGIKVLLDHEGSDLLLCADSIGRLPFHWAAAGPNWHNELTRPDSEVGMRIMETFKLVLVADHDVINLQDKEGATALHYAVSSHAGCGTRNCIDAIRFLCDTGSDASIKNNKGQTVLHVLAYWSLDGEPIDVDLIELLLAHGADISSVDTNGDTALHIMARNLRQVEAARFLVSKGADITAVNAKGNTPVHGVMGGLLRVKRATRGEKHQSVRLADQLKAQDDMIAVIQSGGDYKEKLLDQLNTAGKTPRQILEETRTRWEEVELKISQSR
ncbi:hypothetical protein ZTR_09411 [Talaromyces verruculosus]|nr:hypothetical protein ZTR_09411 [Talaromyces verruculosus]